MDKKGVDKYLLIILLVILIAISFLIIKPFINEILLGFIFAYIFYPVYKKLNLKIKNKYISSILTLILIILIIIIPLIFVANSLIQETILIYKSNTLEKISDFTLKLFGPEIAADQYFEKPITLLAKYTNQIASNFLLSLPSKILAFFIMLFIIFYMLIHGEELLKKVKTLILLKNREEIIDYTGKTIHNLIYGLFIIAILELIVTIIGFKLVGVSTPILWAIVIAILAFIPIIGPAIIWIPLMLMEYFNNNPGKAIGILIVGIILSVIDNIIRQNIIESKSNIHPIITLLGVLGGLKIFGMGGIIIGPLFLSLSIIIIEIYTEKWN